MTTCYNADIFYVHIPKTGGTSIGGRFDAFSGEWSGGWLQEVCDGMTRDGLPHGHIPVRGIEQFTGRPPESFKMILATIRNPFAQQVSQYEFWRERGKEAQQMGMPVHPCDDLAMGVGFEEFVEHDWSNGAYFMSESDGLDWQRFGGVYRWWLANRDGTLPDNLVVVKMEEMTDKLPEVVKPFAAREAPVGHTNRIGKADNWKQRYTPKSAETVRRKFAWSLLVHYPWVFDRLSKLPEVV